MRRVFATVFLPIIGIGFLLSTADIFGTITSYTLSANTAGTGGGTMEFWNGGGYAPPDRSFTESEAVFGMATPNPSSTFVSWSGACTSTSAS